MRYAGVFICHHNHRCQLFLYKSAYCCDEQPAPHRLICGTTTTITSKNILEWCIFLGMSVKKGMEKPRHRSPRSCDADFQVLHQKQRKSIVSLRQLHFIMVEISCEYRPVIQTRLAKSVVRFLMFLNRDVSVFYLFRHLTSKRAELARLGGGVGW